MSTKTSFQGLKAGYYLPRVYVYIVVLILSYKFDKGDDFSNHSRARLMVARVDRFVWINMTLIVVLDYNNMRKILNFFL